jgi:hypothetical protein
MRFRRDQHRFFDDIVAMFTTLVANTYTMKNHRLQVPHLFTPDDYVWFQGMPKVSGIVVGVQALPLIQQQAHDTLPDQLDLVEKPLAAVEIPGGISLNVLKRPSERVFASLYTSYFERGRRLVEARFGMDVSGWPAVWNFGRVVRNAFAHGGQVSITNPNALPVTWRGVTLGPAENGREIFFNDLAYAEIVILLSELDAAV